MLEKKIFFDKDIWVKIKQLDWEKFKVYLLFWDKVFDITKIIWKLLINKEWKIIFSKNKNNNLEQFNNLQSIKSEYLIENYWILLEIISEIIANRQCFNFLKEECEKVKDTLKELENKWFNPGVLIDWEKIIIYNYPTFDIIKKV